MTTESKAARNSYTREVGTHPESENRDHPTGAGRDPGSPRKRDESADGDTKSPRLHFHWGTLVGFALFVLVVLGLAYLLWRLISSNGAAPRSSVQQYVALTVSISFVVMALLGAAFAMVAYYYNEREQKLRERTEKLQKELGGDSFFTTLVRLNYTYLDKYYNQTGYQARRSFWLSTFAAIVALGLVVAGVIMLYGSNATSLSSAAGAAGVISTIAGVLSQFVAAVFFYLYNTTVTKMGEYHQKLVLTQNLGLALRIADEMEDGPDKVRVKEALVRDLATNINQFLTGTKPDTAGAGTARAAV